jgi:hypothetical protein
MGGENGNNDDPDYGIIDIFLLAAAIISLMALCLLFIQLSAFRILVHIF